MRGVHRNNKTIITERWNAPFAASTSLTQNPGWQKNAWPLSPLNFFTCFMVVYGQSDYICRHHVIWKSIQFHHPMWWKFRRPGIGTGPIYHMGYNSQTYLARSETPVGHVRSETFQTIINFQLKFVKTNLTLLAVSSALTKYINTTVGLLGNSSSTCHSYFWPPHKMFETWLPEYQPPTLIDLHVAIKAQRLKRWCCSYYMKLLNG